MCANAETVQCFFHMTKILLAERISNIDVLWVIEWRRPERRREEKRSEENDAIEWNYKQVRRIRYEHTRHIAFKIEWPKKKQRNRSAVGSESRIKEKCVAHKNKITFKPIYFSLSSAVAAAAASSSCLIWPIFDLVTVSQPARQSWILFIIARFDVIFYSFFYYAHLLHSCCCCCCSSICLFTFIAIDLSLAIIGFGLGVFCPRLDFSLTILMTLFTSDQQLPYINYFVYISLRKIYGQFFSMND